MPPVTAYIPKDGASVACYTWNKKALTEGTSAVLCSLLKEQETTFARNSRDVRVSDTDDGEVMMSLAPSRVFGFQYGGDTISVDLFSFVGENQVVQLVVHQQDDEIYYLSKSKELILALERTDEIK